MVNKFTEEHKRKISKAMKGKKPVYSFPKGYIPWNKGLVGEKSHNWKEGKARNKHSLTNPEYKYWHSKVFQRDNWTCQTCGARGCYLEVHHIKSWAKYPKLRFDINNGVTLCRECHKLTNNYKNKK